MSELTIDFDEPFFGGSAAGSAPIPVPLWMVAINGRRYLLDTASGKYGRQGIDVVQQRNTTNARDVLLLPQDVWRAQAESWHQGAGQLNLDREESLQFRYYRSYGIDPWEKYQISLLNETQKVHTLTGADPCFLEVHNGELVICTGGTVTFMRQDYTALTPLTVSAGKIIDTTYDGDGVFTLDDAGVVTQVTDATTATVRVVTPPASPAVPNPVTDATFIAYVNDYLLLGVGNQLWDITATQAKLVFQSPVTGFTFKGATDGNAAIYLVGGAGEKHVIHRVSVNDAGTLLEPGVVAATLPDGEEAVSIGSYLGYVFVGSQLGVRMATPSNTSGDLVLGSLIQAGKPVYAFEGQDRFVWSTWSQVNPVPDDGPVTGFPTGLVNGLARADLSTFTTNVSTPAYATDIVAADQSGKVTRDVKTWQGRRVFSVDNGGVYHEQNEKMPGGWLANGRVSFSVEDIKTGLYVQGKWEPLRGTVAIDLSYDSAKAVRVMNWSVKDSIRSGNIPLNGAQFSRVDTRYVLYRDAADPTLGPYFTRFEIRARAVKGAASRWSLPIINHEELDLNGVIEARDVTEEFFALMRLVETGIMFPLQEWGRTYQVVVKDFTWLPERLNLAGTGWQGVFTLIVEEVR
jgi:hypothetical protein